MADGWRYYNHAMLPTCAPHESVDPAPLRDGSIWVPVQGGRTPLLARWTSDWDCGTPTNWWYCIKDTPFDIASVNAKKRYGIRKGCEHFDVQLIDPLRYVEQLFAVQVAAFSTYPTAYRPHTDAESFRQSVARWSGQKVFVAFEKASGRLCAYAQVIEYRDYANLAVLKADPAFEKLQVNAAILFGILEHYKERLSGCFYIADGERNILHETAFQDYLERTFGFRKAYCKLHLQYRPGIGFLIKLAYPFRSITRKLDFKFAKQLSAILKMEAFTRGRSE